MKKLFIKKREVGKVRFEEIPEERLVDVKPDLREGRQIVSLEINGSMHLIEERRTEEFTGKAIYLPNEFDWAVGEDSGGSVCLVPLKRKLGDE